MRVWWLDNLMRDVAECYCSCSVHAVGASPIELIRKGMIESGWSGKRSAMFGCEFVLLVLSPCRRCVS
jgi:hypothetical protein